MGRLLRLEQLWLQGYGAQGLGGFSETSQFMNRRDRMGKRLLKLATL